MKKAEGCGAIVHLAAVEDQVASKTFQTNLIGTWNILCAAKALQISKVVFLSSVDSLGVFQGEGIPRYLPLDDEYPCHPSTPYSVSKRLAEEMCRYFHSAFGTSIVCLRPPGVWDETTYDKITAMRKARPEYEWNPYWEYGAFIDLRDLVEAILLSLHQSVSGFHCLLVAADDITTSGMTSVQLVQKLHPNVKWIGSTEYLTTPYKSLVKSQAAKKVLGWSPKYTWGAYMEKL
jgi:nucleoside-diphosphate-sugar epimerase